VSEVVITGRPTQVAGLLRLMADEIEQDGYSSTAFSAREGDDPTHTIRLRSADHFDTLVQVHP
jgi:hypothetical protein